MDSSCLRALEELVVLSNSPKSELLKSDINTMIHMHLGKLGFPNDLYFLYEKINGGYNLFFDYFYSLDEAFEKKNEYIELFDDMWLKSWLPIGSDDVFDFFIPLVEQKKETFEIYYMDIGGGDPNIYLYSPNFCDLVSLELERFKLLQSMGKKLGYRDLYLKFIPDAYPYFERKSQKGFFSQNGTRNLYNILDKEELPKDWL